MFTVSAVPADTPPLGGIYNSCRALFGGGRRESRNGEGGEEVEMIAKKKGKGIRKQRSQFQCSAEVRSGLVRLGATPLLERLFRHPAPFAKRFATLCGGMLCEARAPPDATPPPRGSLFRG